MNFDAFGFNVINIAFSFLARKESELRKITPNYIKGLLERLNLIYNIKFVKGYNIQRFIFHYRYGFKNLASIRVGEYIYNLINLIPIPRVIYSYMIIDIKK